MQDIGYFDLGILLGFWEFEKEPIWNGSQIRGQGIHTVISLCDLRDASLENTSGPSSEVRVLVGSKTIENKGQRTWIDLCLNRQLRIQPRQSCRCVILFSMKKWSDRKI